MPKSSDKDDVMEEGGDMSQNEASFPAEEASGAQQGSRKMKRKGKVIFLVIAILALLYFVISVLIRLIACLT